MSKRKIDLSNINHHEEQCIETTDILEDEERNIDMEIAEEAEWRGIKFKDVILNLFHNYPKPLTKEQMMRKFNYEEF